MSEFEFVTLRLGKDSVEDIKAIDERDAGIQDPPYDLSVVCKQVPRQLKSGAYAIIWLGSDNSKGMQTDWKQGIRAIATITQVDLGEKHNDDSTIGVSIGYIFQKSIDKINLIDSYATAYKYFACLPIVGLNDYSNQTVREIESGPRRDVGALLAACGKASSSSLDDIFVVYPELQDLIKGSYDKVADSEVRYSERISQPHNLIFFGAPGTGKSYQLNALALQNFKREHMRRVTFYPDYTYSQFLGSYRPYAYDDAPRDAHGTHSKKQITYEYVTGPFLDTYLDAVTHPHENYLLIVEEINRANPAAVFGDIFQLLDRKPDGVSEYRVAVPRDMEDAIVEYWLLSGGLEYDQKNEIAEFYGMPSQESMLDKLKSSLALPGNMYIWATMNSADQGVFPMDTAFKRRWNFRYMDIDAGENSDLGDGTSISDKVVSLCGVPIYWNKFRKALNDLMRDAHINEDKLLGPFFLTPSALSDDIAADDNGDSVFTASFKDKVLLYLYEDAGKMHRPALFADDTAGYFGLRTRFDRTGVDTFNGIDLSSIRADGVGDSSDLRDGE
ncbi:MAG: AAA family ATPase [Berryella intestinalis]|uniref:AAA family ATPase n=1 Tax=Berryella intestinalis TaxID=1531429 RepID=UPI002A74FFDD|nr:AAA family ATPase [Berryella intestinalis]MDY3129324.1 AAA family ATPase [Berryella intestinalis]